MTQIHDQPHKTVNGKIQEAEQLKVHTMLVIGGRDMEAGNVSLHCTAKATSAPSRRAK
jgi:threonyl-tRNA synthetase